MDTLRQPPPPLLTIIPNIINTEDAGEEGAEAGANSTAPLVTRCNIKHQCTRASIHPLNSEETTATMDAPTLLHKETKGTGINPQFPPFLITLSPSLMALMIFSRTR